MSREKLRAIARLALEGIAGERDVAISILQSLGLRAEDILKDEPGEESFEYEQTETFYECRFCGAEIVGAAPICKNCLDELMQRHIPMPPPAPDPIQPAEQFIEIPFREEVPTRFGCMMVIICGAGAVLLAYACESCK